MNGEWRHTPVHSRPKILPHTNLEGSFCLPVSHEPTQHRAARTFSSAIPAKKLGAEGPSSGRSQDVLRNSLAWGEASALGHQPSPLDVTQDAYSTVLPKRTCALALSPLLPTSYEDAERELPSCRKHSL
ncbi:hypothetical protein V2G26_009661 [Clonostachys chloroleuca]